jgi:hypothetical protein
VVRTAATRDEAGWWEAIWDRLERAASVVVSSPA